MRGDVRFPVRRSSTVVARHYGLPLDPARCYYPYRRFQETGADWADRAPFTAFVNGELDKWARVVRTVALKAE
jgi:hypothetical protein